jgi:hypothetical protein
VGGVVVHDQVDVEVVWHAALDLAQEAEELTASMAGIIAPDDGAHGGVESRKQGSVDGLRSRAISLIVLP